MPYADDWLLSSRTTVSVQADTVRRLSGDGVEPVALGTALTTLPAELCRNRRREKYLSSLTRLSMHGNGYSGIARCKKL